MKGLRYVNMSNSSKVENCTRLEDELCNGGPTVWSRFNKTKVYLRSFGCLIIPAN